MRISELLTESMVIAGAQASSKEAMLRILADRLSSHPDVHVAADAIFEGLLGRERLGSTGVGGGVAIPHAKIPGLGRLVACFARTPEGVAFDAIDGLPARLIFALLVPENSAGAHLKALARISRLLKNESFREVLLAQPDGQAIYTMFLTEDQKR